MGRGRRKRNPDRFPIASYAKADSRYPGGYVAFRTGDATGDGLAKAGLYRWPNFDEAKAIVESMALAFGRSDVTVQVVPPTKKNQPPHIGQEALF